VLGRFGRRSCWRRLGWRLGWRRSASSGHELICSVGLRGSLGGAPTSCGARGHPTVAGVGPPPLLRGGDV